MTGCFFRLTILVQWYIKWEGNMVWHGNCMALCRLQWKIHRHPRDLRGIGHGVQEYLDRVRLNVGKLWEQPIKLLHASVLSVLVKCLEHSMVDLCQDGLDINILLPVKDGQDNFVRVAVRHFDFALLALELDGRVVLRPVPCRVFGEFQPGLPAGKFGAVQVADAFDFAFRCLELELEPSRKADLTVRMLDRGQEGGRLAVFGPHPVRNQLHLLIDGVEKPANKQSEQARASASGDHPASIR